MFFTDRSKTELELELQLRSYPWRFHQSTVPCVLSAIVDWPNLIPRACLKAQTDHPLKLATSYLVAGRWKDNRRASPPAPNHRAVQ